MRYAVIIAIVLTSCGSDPRPAPQDTEIATDVLEPETIFPELVEVAESDATEAAEVEISAGEFGASCENNGECDSGWCVESDSGLVCTRACDDACPQGFDCRGVTSGRDLAFICVPEFTKLCTSCTQDLDCGRGICLTQEGTGRCAPRCDTEGCGVGYACRSDQSGRVNGLFCQPESGSCDCVDDRQHGAERACSVATETGRCSGVEVCGEGGWGTCSAATPSAEDCNGRDDDCDGEVDEDLHLGDACSNDVPGVGSCPGTRVCNGTLGWACAGPAPTPEICDTLDSDCDGQTDEDFKDAGVFSRDAHCGRCGNDCTTRFANGVGRCGAGLECEVARCSDGFVLFGGQCVPPIDTTCQSCVTDDDCLGGSCVTFGDGGTKICAMPCGAGCGAGLTCTSFPVGQRCAPTSGSCACTPALAGNQRTCTNENGAGRCLGSQTCDGTAWSACSAATPRPEQCNAADDDCDGAIDEGEDARWDDLGLVCTVGDGICRNVGVYACDASNPAGPAVCSESAGLGHAETCDGRDEDCDGATDEGVVAPACALTLGVCANSKEVCGGTSGFIACAPASYGPSYEVAELSCDGQDNDCDGATDEVDADGDSYVAAACGHDDCDDGDPLVWPGADEIWDAKDNDCDGVVDEGVIPVGTVIVTEVMRQPSTVDGAYIEVTNLGASVVDLRSWQVAGETITHSVRIAPAATAVICRAAASFCDNVAGFTLGSSVSLALVGTVIDAVDVASLPSATGRAATLDPSQYTASANDTSGNWCVAPLGDVLAGGGNGSPGRPNTSCSGVPAVTGIVPASGTEHGGDALVISGSGFVAATGVTVGGVACANWVIDDDNQMRCTAPPHAPGKAAVVVTKGGAAGTLANAYTYTGEDVTVITWCDVQWPATVRVTVGAASELIFGQVRAQGVTEPGGPPPGITGQVGYGPRNSDPRTTPDWVWTDASWNLQFFDNDEFKGTLTVTRTGTYSYAYRFSDDGSTSYMYGDFDPGTADGFSIANLGTLIVD